MKKLTFIALIIIASTFVAFAQTKDERPDPSRELIVGSRFD